MWTHRLYQRERGKEFQMRGAHERKVRDPVRVRFVAPRGTGHQKSATVELLYSDAEDKRDNWADMCEESCELNEQF